MLRSARRCRIKREVSPRELSLNLVKTHERCPGFVQSGAHLCLFLWGCRDAAMTCGVDETGPGRRRAGAGGCAALLLAAGVADGVGALGAVWALRMHSPCCGGSGAGSASSPACSAGVLPPSFSLAVAGTAAAADVGGDRTGDHGRRGGGGIFAASGKLSRAFEGEASRCRNVSEL